MTKALALILGFAYALMGVAGLFDTGLVGTDGFFAADGTYSLALLLVGAVLLAGVVAGRTNIAGLVAGTLLAVVALSGFLIMPGKGEMFRVLVNGVDHWFNLLLGVLLAGVSLLENAPEFVERPRTARTKTFRRSAQSPRYTRYATHA